MECDLVCSSGDSKDCETVLPKAWFLKPRVTLFKMTETVDSEGISCLGIHLEKGGKPLV